MAWVEVFDKRGKWQRKALWRLEKKGAPECHFKSDTIPASLNAAIEGSLKVANTEEAVKDIFIDAMSWESYPYTGVSDQLGWMKMQSEPISIENVFNPVVDQKMLMDVMETVKNETLAMIHGEMEEDVTAIAELVVELTGMVKSMKNEDSETARAIHTTLQQLIKAMDREIVVNVPEQKAPEVTVNVPVPKKITRTPKRTFDNRIESVEETREY